LTISPRTPGCCIRVRSPHAIKGVWGEVARDRSTDSTLLYGVGLLTDGDKHNTSHAYVQIWQYDAKVANWGLRVLLVKKLRPTVDSAEGHST